MNDLVARRRVPLAVAAVVVAVVSVAVFRLPELFVAQLRRGAPLQGQAASVAFWILLVIAVGQAAYGAFAVLRPERVDEPSRETPAPRIATAVAWVAAGLVGLTLVYGLAMFFLTGLRAGFWAFVAVMAIQLAWYYRAVGEVLGWLGRQPEPPPEKRPPWRLDDRDYLPPIARGLMPVGGKAP